MGGWRLVAGSVYIQKKGDAIEGEGSTDSIGVSRGELAGKLPALYWNTSQ